MGTGSSRPQELNSNEALKRLVSPEPLSPDHPFWNGLLSFTRKTPRSRDEWKELEENIEELLKRLAVNNLKSGNFGSLLEIFLARASELESSIQAESSMFVWQTFNALFILRIIIKFFVERLKEDDVFRQFCALPNQVGEVGDQSGGARGDPGKRMQLFVDTVISIVTDLPSSDLAYGLQCESIGALLALLSTPMYKQKPTFQLRSYRAVMISERAPNLTEKLLKNFTDEKPAPATYMNEEGGSLVFGLASGVWSVLTLGYGSSATSPKADLEPECRFIKHPLADSSLLLLLVLTNHCTDPNQLPNPYRDSLVSCANSASKEASEDHATKCKCDFGQLFKTLCGNLNTDQSTLLLYSLLHQNQAFKSHVLASADMESLVIPILKTLYNAPDSSNHHIYMSLIVLLILSEDDLFNTSIHDVGLKNIDWYTERSLVDISLGGLLILVVIRTIQYNMLKMRDKYLHTNCLAALANMSGQFKNLHPYVSQRIVSMFEALVKKHGRLVTELRSENGEGEEDPLAHEAMADVAVLEEVLRMILEIMNSCLVNQIKSNSNLIYTLVYKKELFEPFATHPSFQDLSQNIQTVIRYFNAKLEQIQEKKERTLSVIEVQDVIKQTAMQFPREKLTKFPDLKFKYVEEEQPEDFFVPYVWTLVTKTFYWNPKFIKILDDVD